MSWVNERLARTDHYPVSKKQPNSEACNDQFNFYSFNKFGKVKNTLSSVRTLGTINTHRAPVSSNIANSHTMK